MIHETKKPVIVISGPSGVGKSTVIHHFVALHPEFALVRSVTTRKKRNDDDCYLYVDESTFDSMELAGEFLETDRYLGVSYGTPRQELDRLYEENKIPILDIIYSGMKNLKANKEFDMKTIFLWASPHVLLKRIREREGEDKNRYKHASKLSSAIAAIEVSSEYDFLVNTENDIDDTTDKLEKIILGDGTTYSSARKKIDIAEYIYKTKLAIAIYFEREKRKK